MAKQTKVDLLVPYGEQIHQWAQQGLSLRQIAEHLKVSGVETDHSAVRRFLLEKPRTPLTSPASSNQHTVVSNERNSTYQSDQRTDANQTARPQPTPVGGSASIHTPPHRDPPTFVVGNFLVPDQRFESRTPPERDAVQNDTMTSAVPSEPSPPKHTQPEVKPVAPQSYPPAPTINRRQWRNPELPFPRLATRPVWTPDVPMIQFGEGDVWSLQDALEGCFITGAIGSGKTSGSGRTLAHSFLETGFGGLVLTVKDDERDLWEKYARQTGREDQLCVVEIGGPYRLNFLDYELHRPTRGAGLIENLVYLFFSAANAYRPDQKSIENADFWDKAGRQLLRNTFRVLERSRQAITLADMRKFITQAPVGLDAVGRGHWQDTDFGLWLHWATENARGTRHEGEIVEARTYWLNQFASLSEKTRSSIVIDFGATADVFVDYDINRLFCTDTTLTPDAALDGAIILIDIPLKTFNAAGIFAQAIWKTLFQQAVERRADPNGPTRRPVFLWADEAQFFYNAHDGLFQSTARSSRCATTYLTQNLSNFYNVSGGKVAAVDGFLGNLCTKIFHCNNDPTTNRWAAEQIGRFKKYQYGSSTQLGAADGSSANSSETVDYAVQPSEFLQLRSGSDAFDRQIDAYFVKSGATFSNGKHFFKTVFEQEQL